MNQLLKVLIVVADSDLEADLTRLLHDETDIVVMGKCNRKQSAVNLALVEEADVILTDLKLTDSVNDEILLTKEIAKRSLAVIIALIDLDNDELIKRIWETGVKEYLYKNQLHWLSDKIRDVYHRRSPTVVLLDKINKLENETRFNKLTPSEKEILALLKAGFSIEEIVKKLCKAEKTVHNQKSSLLKKLGVTCYKEAMEKYNDFIG